MKGVYLRRDLDLEKELGEAIEKAIEKGKDNLDDALYGLYVLGGILKLSLQISILKD